MMQPRACRGQQHATPVGTAAIIIDTNVAEVPATCFMGYYSQSSLVCWSTISPQVVDRN